MSEPNSPPTPLRATPPSATDPSASAPAPLWESSDEGILLIGWACQRCGQRGIPRQYFGCERCGAPRTEIAESRFPARGVLRSYAVVERHAVWSVPFVLGEIELDSGQVLHSFLSSDAEWKPGMRVAADPGDESRKPYVIFKVEG